MMKPMSTWLSYASLICILGLQGCGEGTIDEQAAFQQAVSYQQQDNHKSAIIELKNVLKVNPQHIEAQKRLAQSYEVIGMYLFAEKELSKVVAQQDTPEHRLALAKVLLVLGENQRVAKLLEPTEIWSDKTAVDRFALLAQLALLSKQLTKQEQAEQALVYLTKARELERVTAELLFASALQALAYDEREQALTNLNKAIEQQAFFAKAMQLRGQVLLEQQDYPQAIAQFTQLAKQQYSNPDVLLNLAQAYLVSEQDELLEQTLAQILKVIPNHVEANYLKAYLMLEDKQYQAAMDMADKVLGLDGSHIAAHFVAAASAYPLEQYEKAFAHITKVTYAYPNYSDGIKLKAAIEFKLGDELAATETLSAINASDFNQQDASLLKAAGEALLQNKDFILSRQLFAQAAQLAQDDRSLNLLMAKAAFLQPDIDQGIAQLQEVQQKLPEQDDIEVALILNYLKKGDVNEALQRAVALQQRLPELEVGWLLQGAAYFLNEQLEPAEQAFLKALEIAPENKSARYNLAALALKSKDYALAQQHYQAVLAQDKTDLKSLMQLHFLAIRADELEQGLAYLTQALSYHPDNLEVNLPMIEYLFFNNQPQQALVLASNMLEKHPQPTAAQAKILFYSGVLLQYFQQWELAKQRLAAFTARYPASYLGHFHLAHAHAMTNDLASARRELDKALQANAFYPPIAMLDIRLLLSEGKYVETREAIANYRQRFPNTAMVDEMQARLELAQGNFGDAIRYYERALQSTETNFLLLQLANAHWSADEQQQAISLLSQWLERYQQDVLVLRVLADYQMLAGKDQAAIASLKQLSEQVEPDYHIENNLAWLYHKKGDYPQALKHAQSAHDMAPDNPGVMDTLAVILLQQGDGITAERLLTRAVQAAPDNPEIQHHLAQAMLKNGKKEQAKAVLEKLIADFADYSGLSETKALLSSIS
ncbi:XrtA/PEP-CTERM system TPR-repeat protein PrsT [Motilimonas eburnea]|uniref:XrtA/PEP-CTERM system TPR-repeat protein PrsT n=1 Tax=Motilimonas eburnea TaxID=1737488 RepID=UPI001E5EBE34|nr:XrtA/PEP-CTERM system TPR-repeat protein PrsT [Motilimonas eburnea]MCE2571240.1 PEP-CTERM system TPR-repeat protein PrsT [Motilimonas eburnea]